MALIKCPECKVGIYTKNWDLYSRNKIDKLKNTEVYL